MPLTFTNGVKADPINGFDDLGQPIVICPGCNLIVGTMSGLRRHTKTACTFPDLPGAPPPPPYVAAPLPAPPPPSAPQILAINSDPSPFSDLSSSDIYHQNASFDFTNFTSPTSDKLNPQADRDLDDDEHPARHTTSPILTQYPRNDSSSSNSDQANLSTTAVVSSSQLESPQPMFTKVTSPHVETSSAVPYTYPRKSGMVGVSPDSLHRLSLSTQFHFTPLSSPSPPAPPKPQLAPVESALIVAPQLQPYSVVLNIKLKIPVCTLCQAAILAPHLLGHMRNTHKVNIPLPVVQSCIRTYGLAVAAHQVHLPDFPCDPLPGLEVQQGFACDFPGCKNATTSLGTLKKKCAAAHPNPHGPKHIDRNAMLQRIYLDSIQYHRVRPPVETPPEGSLLDAWLKSRAPRPVFTIREDRDVPPWLRRLGWIKRIGKVSTQVGEVIRDKCKAPASSHPWTILDDAFYDYLSLAGRISEEGPRWVSIKIKAKTYELSRKDFIAPQQDTTLQRYASWEYRCFILLSHLCDLHRQNRPVAFVNISPELLHAQAAIQTRIEKDSDVTPRQLLMLIHYYYRAVFAHTYDRDEQVLMDPLMAWIMFWHWKGDEYFAPPNLIAPHLSGTNFAGNSYGMLETVHLVSITLPDVGFWGEYIPQEDLGSYVPHLAELPPPFSGPPPERLEQALDQVLPFLREEKPSPMQSVYLLMDTLTTLASEVVHLPEFLWGDDTQEELYFRGVRITLAAFKGMFHSLLEKCETTIGSLLLDFPIDSLGLNLGDVFDNLSDPLQPGRSLFSHPSNPLEQGCIARRLCALPRDEPRSKQWITGIVDGQVMWNVNTVLAWSELVKEWLADFHTIAYLGQHSKRGVEFRSISLHDLDYSMAGIRAFKGQLYFVICAHKQDHITGRRKAIPLFLHPRVARLLHLFMVVRDHQIEMAQIFSPKAVPPLTTYLWASMNGHWKDAEAKTILKKRTLEGMGVALGVSKLRQFLCFLWPAKIGQEAAEDILPTNETTIAIHLAAAHTALTAAQNYGVHRPTCPTLPEPVFRAIYKSTQKIWVFFGLDPVGPVPAPGVATIVAPPNVPVATLDLNAVAAAVAGLLETRVEHVLTRELRKTPLALPPPPDPSTGMTVTEQGGLTIVDGPEFVHPSLLARLADFFPAQGTWFKSPEQAMAIQLAANRQHHFAFHAPTGSGKSLVWMMAAKLWESRLTTVVFCPTLSLQADFHARCRQFDIQTSIWHGAHHDPGEPAVLLVTPDRSDSTAFWEHLETRNRVQRLARIVLEEAHLLQTAKNYRPVMDRLTRIVQAGVQVIFVSATMPAPIIPPLMRQIGLTHLRILRACTARLNISYNRHLCQNKKERQASVMTLARELLGELREGDCVIIVCTTIDDTHFYAKELPSCVWFNSKLSADEQAQVLRNFKAGSHKFIACTNGLTQGTDIAHVRAVLSDGPPNSLIQAIQDVGRAGRDNRRAEYHLFSTANQLRTVSGPDPFGTNALSTLMKDTNSCVQEHLTRFNDGRPMSCAALPSLLCDYCRTIPAQAPTPAISFERKPLASITPQNVSRTLSPPPRPHRPPPQRSSRFQEPSLAPGPSSSRPRFEDSSPTPTIPIKRPHSPPPCTPRLTIHLPGSSDDYQSSSPYLPGPHILHDQANTLDRSKRVKLNTLDYETALRSLSVYCAYHWSRFGKTDSTHTTMKCPDDFTRPFFSWKRSVHHKPGLCWFCWAPRDAENRYTLSHSANKNSQNRCEAADFLPQLMFAVWYDRDLYRLVSKTVNLPETEEEYAVWITTTDGEGRSNISVVFWAIYKLHQG